MNILIVGGTWSTEQNPDGTYGRESNLVHKMVAAITNRMWIKPPTIDYYNGGPFDLLKTIVESDKPYDMVFWWANVEDNTLDKTRNVKEFRPHTMLVNSKRNDNNKYDFQELIQRTLAVKANLTVEFSKQDNGIFNFRIFDPLGCVWYNGTDVQKAMDAMMNRLEYLRSITRQQTTQSHTDKSLVMSWYFDTFKQPEYQSDKNIEIPNEQEFVDIVRKYSYEFHKFMPTTCKTERFVGNASFRPMMPPQVGRCSKGMPSFRKGDYIFVSKRNVDKQFIELDNFVPVYLEDDKLYYCGDEKPSVDTPVQVRLYNALPNINYMLHSHCYIDGAPFTTKAIPCGAIEEFDEVIDTIKAHYNNDLTGSYYAINMKGHGALVMTNGLTEFENIPYITRPLPEIM